MASAKIIKPVAFTVEYEIYMTHDIWHIVEPGTLNELLGISLLARDKTDDEMHEDLSKLLINKGNFTCVGFRDHRV